MYKCRYNVQVQRASPHPISLRGAVVVLKHYISYILVVRQWQELLLLLLIILLLALLLTVVAALVLVVVVVVIGREAAAHLVAVLEDDQDILLELLMAPVLPGVHLPLHCAKVHWFLWQGSN